MAVKEGFEPSIPVIRYGSLAGNWFQPLTHFTELRLDKLLNLFGHHIYHTCISHMMILPVVVGNDYIKITSDCKRF